MNRTNNIKHQSFQKINRIDFIRDYDGYFLPKDIYGKIFSVKAKLKFMKDSMQIRLGINVEFERHYQMRIVRGEPEGISVEIHKKTDAPRCLAKAIYKKELPLDRLFFAEIVNDNGKLSAFINGEKIISFDDSTSNEICTKGMAGIQFVHGEGECSELQVSYAPIGRKKEKQDILPTCFYEKFEECVYEKPEYWLEKHGEDYWRMAEYNGIRAYGTAGVATYTHTYLHVFDCNTVAKYNFTMCSQSTEAKAGFIFRMGPENMNLKFGYDFNVKRWYFAETLPNSVEQRMVYAQEKIEMQEQEWYCAEIFLKDENAVLSIDGKTILSVNGIRHIGCGRVGIYSQGAAFYVKNAEFVFAQGGVPNKGIVEYTIDTDIYTTAMQIVELADKKLVGIMRDEGKFVSENEGYDFFPLSDEYEIDTLGGYPNYVRLADGRYLSVNMETYEVSISEDMKKWTHIGNVFPSDEVYDEKKRRRIMFHLNSLKEIETSNGTKRILLPNFIRTFRKDKRDENICCGNYTIVYYSDDGGKNWKMSTNSTRDLPFGGYFEDENSHWGESKVILCKDGKLRMYLSRARFGCMQYTESTDFGETWFGIYQLPQMQCAVSSFSVAEDSYDKGTFYLVWVNDTGSTYGSLQNRTRISLAKSKDGINWSFVCDLDRSDCRYSDDICSNSPLYQILDPSITVTEKCVLVSFGRSENSFANAQKNTWQNYHHAQKVRVVRLEKAFLQEKEWDASNIADMNFISAIEIEKLPNKLVYKQGETIDLFGGKIRATSLNGKQVIKEMRSFPFVDYPDTTYVGNKKVVIYDKSGFSCSFDINVIGR